MAIEILTRLYDGPAGRRAGDFITVKQVPCTWGNAEGLPHYSIIYVDDVDLIDVENFVKRHVPTERDGEGNIIASVRSMYRLDIDAMQTQDRNDLFAGRWEAGLNDVNAHIINRIDNG